MKVAGSTNKVLCLEGSGDTVSTAKRIFDKSTREVQEVGSPVRAGAAAMGPLSQENGEGGGIRKEVTTLSKNLN